MGRPERTIWSECLERVPGASAWMNCLDGGCPFFLVSPSLPSPSIPSANKQVVFFRMDSIGFPLIQPWFWRKVLQVNVTASQSTDRLTTSKGSLILGVLLEPRQPILLQKLPHEHLDS